MAINLETLSPAELQALIENAEAPMQKRDQVHFPLEDGRESRIVQLIHKPHPRAARHRASLRLSEFVPSEFVDDVGRIP